jgi:hypothetical protein
MAFLVEGRVVTFAITLGLLVAILYFVQRAKRGSVPKIRSLPPLDAVQDAVARAAEMGKPVHFTTGFGGGGLATEFGPYHLAGLTVLGKVSELTAKYDVPLIGSFCHSELVPLAEDIIKTSYVKEGKPQAVKPEMAQLVGGQQFPYAMGVMGILMETNPAANVMVGNFWAESLLIAETGNIVGALQIGGGADITAVPLLVAACDYVLMFEEEFAARAYLTKDPALTGSIASQDVFKILALILGVVGVVLATAGVDWSWFLNL